jgi:transposase-like protein
MAAAACWRSECGTAKEREENPLLRYRFSPEIRHQAIRLYLRFTLSFRDVEDLLAERRLRYRQCIVAHDLLRFGLAVAGSFAREAEGSRSCDVAPD